MNSFVLSVAGVSGGGAGGAVGGDVSSEGLDEGDFRLQPEIAHNPTRATMDRPIPVILRADVLFIVKAPELSGC